MKNKILAIFLLTVFFIAASGRLASAESPEIGRLRTDRSPVQDMRQLVRAADLIVFGTVMESVKSYPTGQTSGKERIFNYVQRLSVREVLKGRTPQSGIRIMTTGIEPLPPATDPRNREYSGPLAEGDYVMFLRTVPGSSLYSPIGVWQGIYPVIEGKTVALREGGFSALGDLTVSQLRRKIGSLNVSQKRTSEA